jgi:hypothetical protein
MISVSGANALLVGRAQRFATTKRAALSERVLSATRLRGALEEPNRNWLVRALLTEDLAFIDETRRLAEAAVEEAKSDEDAWKALPVNTQLARVWDDAVASLRSDEPEAIDTLESYHRRLELLKEMSRTLSNRAMLVEPFLSGNMEATLYGDVHKDMHGNLYRHLHVQDGDSIRHFVTPQSSTLRDGAGTGVLSFSDFDGVDSIWKETSFGVQFAAAPLTNVTKYEAELNTRFARVIERRAERLDTWQENLISADIIDILEEQSKLTITVGNLVYYVVLTVFKQQGRREHLHGDVCVVVETQNDAEYILGAALLEAKKLDLISRRFRSIEEEQLQRIQSHTTNGRLLLYSPAPSHSDWWTSTLPLEDYLKALPLRKDAQLSGDGRTLGNQFAQRYFIGKDLDPGKDAVESAVAAAGNCTRGIHVAVGVGRDEDLAKKLELKIPAHVRYLMARAFGQRLDLELERGFGHDDHRGLGRGRGRGRDLGGFER